MLVVVLRMIAVLAVLGILTTLLAYGRKRGLAPELSRKGLHVGMGLVSLSLPWLFDSPAPVLVLTGAAFVLMLAVRLAPSIRARYGGVVHGVARTSLGDLYYPVSVGVLFYLADGDPILFSIPMLVLSFADALSALIGMRYGLTRYATHDGQKSLEGSTAFFTVAFLATHVPLLLATDTGRAECLLIAIILGLLVMLMEAVSWKGLDNLFVPLGAFVLLRIYLTLELPQLGMRLAVCIALVAFLFLWKGETTLLTSGLLGAVLFGYVSWALGGWQWLLPGLFLLLAYPFLSPKNEINKRQVHDIHAVLSVTGASLFWLFFAHTLDNPAFYYLYVLAFAAQLGIIGVARLCADYPTMPRTYLLIRCTLIGWLIQFVPFLWIHRGSATSWLLSAVALVACAVATTSFFLLQPGVDHCPRDAPRWLRQGLCPFAATLLGLAALHALNNGW